MGFFILIILAIIIGIVLLIITKEMIPSVSISIILIMWTVLFFLDPPKPKPDIYNDTRFEIVSETSYELIPLSKFYQDATEDQYITVNKKGQYGYYIYKNGVYKYQTTDMIPSQSDVTKLEHIEISTKLSGVRAFFTLNKEDTETHLNAPENIKIYLLN